MSGKHYALVLSKVSHKDNTLLVAPITSKKKGKNIRVVLLLTALNTKRTLLQKKRLLKLEK